MLRLGTLAGAVSATIAVLSCGGGDQGGGGRSGAGGISGASGGAPPTGEQGTLRGPCYPNGTCNAGLVCASDVCVVLPPGAGGTAPAGTGGGPAGGGTGGGGAGGSGGSSSGGTDAGPDTSGDAATGGSSDGGAGGAPTDAAAGGSGGRGDGGTCIPRACPDDGVTCGQVDDGCGEISACAHPCGQGVTLYVMQDRSSSMVGIPGDPSRWPNATGALAAFVTDPASAGFEVGLGFFPPLGAMADSATQGSCSDGSDCGAPAAAIAPLPDNAAPIQAALQAATPPTGLGAPIFFTPTECALRGMLNECQRFAGASGRQCAAVLITDGEPTLCNVDSVFLRSIVTAGAASGIPTHVIALPGSNAAFLHDLAQAGGTSLLDLTGGGSQAAVLAALGTIRGRVATAACGTTVANRCGPL